MTSEHEVRKAALDFLAADDDVAANGWNSDNEDRHQNAKERLRSLCGYTPSSERATPDWLRRMRNPLNRRNLDMIRSVLRYVAFCLDCRSQSMPDVEDWRRQVRDDLGKCCAVLWEERERRRHGRA